MSSDFVPPVFPSNNQTQIPADPQRELEKKALEFLPSWQEPSKKHVGSSRTDLSALQGVSATLWSPVLRQIQNDRETNPLRWPGLESETPYRVLGEFSIPFGSEDAFQTWISTATSDVPFIKNPSLELTQTGILCVSNSGAFYSPLPPRSSWLNFWMQGFSPSLRIEDGVTILRNLDRTVLDFQPSQTGGFLPYRGSVSGFPFESDTEQIKAFDFPFLPQVEGFRPLGIQRGSFSGIYPVVGPTVIPNSWDIDGIDTFEGILIPQFRTGESSSVSYVSQGKHAVLKDDPLIIVQTDAGRFYAGEEKYPGETQGPGAPSRGFLSRYPSLLRHRRQGESHGVRIQRLLTLERLRTLSGLSLRESRWRILGVLGRLNEITITGNISVTGDVLIPSLEGVVSHTVVFSNLDPGLETVRQSLIEPTTDTLISPVPLEQRISGSQYGGVRIPARSRMSPFSRTSRVPDPQALSPFPVSEFWKREEASSSYGLLSRSLQKTELPLKSQGTRYESDGVKTRIISGTISRNQTLVGLESKSEIQIRTPGDALLRGDPSLSSTTPIWKSLTRGTSERTSWKDAPGIKKGNSLLDPDLSSPDYQSSFPSYGAGSYPLDVVQTHPLAKDFA